MTIEKREGEFKAAVMSKLKDRSPRAMIAEIMTPGWPDRLVSFGGVTSFWEMKHGTPDFESPGLQELMCCRLELSAYCRYVIWQESSKGHGQRTLIVRPIEVKRRKGWEFYADAWCVGFDHGWVADQIAQAHIL